MAFESFADFLAMGKHGFFVWTAYGISAVLVIANMVLALRGQGKVRETLARQQRRAEVDE
ncbi:heme exporter protein D [Alcanivorax nanhaiticus]|uniref:Heme exporter protein D n=1 Tax=Alcanivorax nanhaiticus TaxID=1177154 RepID=A0A095SQS7_9GAMM|nr:heme exporter protein CcmD [Alcanivorax nanhaiticus]KGD66684.1 heme exporter protein D [Alcanivorax nanhaiticus]